MFTKSCEVRLPSGKPLPTETHGFELVISLVWKLSIIFPSNHKIFSSSISLFKISFKIVWSILAKNFLMSHFNTKHCFVLFLLTFNAKLLNLFRPLCVPFLNLQEYESLINLLSKNGYRTL